MFTAFGYTELVRLRCKQGLNPFAMGLRRAAAALAPRGAPSCPPPAHTDTSVPVPAGTTPPQCGPKTAGGGEDAARGRSGRGLSHKRHVICGDVIYGTGVETRPQTSSTGRGGGEQNRPERYRAPSKQRAGTAGTAGTADGLSRGQSSRGEETGTGTWAPRPLTALTQPAGTSPWASRPGPGDRGHHGPKGPGGARRQLWGRSIAAPRAVTPRSQRRFRFPPSLKQEAANCALGAGRSGAARRIKVSAGAALRARLEPTRQAAGSTGPAPV